jgi:predicted Zn-ribbon and HTH transcriptional regulator
MRCPECGYEDFTTWTYDYGEDRETGYRDSGVRAKCAKCGHEADVEDFQERA